MKAPFKVLFSNDTTNIQTCVSPYHKKGESWRPEMLEATVDEVAGTGVDAHFIQPAFCWVPWWQSKLYPPSKHYKWFRQLTRWEPTGIDKWVEEGGDVIKVFVERCQKKGQMPFFSIRLNHPPLDGAELMRWTNRFWLENVPEYGIGPDPGNLRCLDWAVDKVRQQKFDYIKEVVENYSIAGVELDFMRFPCFFDLKKTSTAKRITIMTDFVKRVRHVLDKTDKAGQHRWLCIRIPSILACHDKIGIDVQRLVKEAGLDMINLSDYYFTTQQNDVAKICKMVPTTRIYFELTYCTSRDTSKNFSTGEQWRRVANDHINYTAAHLAYQRGAAGISLFNFVYYRWYGKVPFHIIEHLGDPAWLAQQPQWYVWDKGQQYSWLGVKKEAPPVKLDSRRSYTLKIDLAPTKNHKQDGVLRLFIEESQAKGCKWRVKVNGVELRKIFYVHKPLEHSYDKFIIGKPEQHVCFRCPRKTVVNGVNDITIQQENGRSLTLSYLDLVLPASEG